MNLPRDAKITPIKGTHPVAPLRVAFVVYRFPELSETFVINQACGLVEAGHDLTIFTLTDHLNDEPMHEKVEKYGLLDRVYSLDRKKNKAERFLKGLPDMARNPAIAGRIVRKKNENGVSVTLRQLSEIGFFKNHAPFDIIHCQFGTAGLDVLSEINSGVLRTKKLLIHLRGSDITSFVQSNGKDVYRPLFARADWVLTNSHSFRERAISLGASPDTTSVHYSGVDCKKFSYRERFARPDQATRLLTVARLVEKKGLEYAIDAVGDLVKQGIDLSYDIVGSGPLHAPLDAKIKSLGLENHIRLCGAKTHEEIIQHLNDSDIFLAPSVTAANGDQDAPVNTLKEAMLVGLPVIATNHGGIPELVEHQISGLLSPERDSQALAANIRQLIDTPDNWSAYGKAGREKVEQNFDINALNNDLINLYKDVIEDI